MTKLSVNVNKIALLRNSRTIGIPSPARFGAIAVAAGAHGLTVHPRPDERHIRRSDVAEVARAAGGAEFNIEGNPLEGAWMDIIRSARPRQATLVPDSPDQATSDHGWNLARDLGRLGPIIEELKGLGCRVALFVDAGETAFAAAKAAGAERVELYTEPYAAAFARGDARDALASFAATARAAAAAGLGVNAGHDLNLENLGPFLRAVPNVLEVSIGHALIAEALEFGMAETVRRYLAVIDSVATTDRR